LRTMAFVVPFMLIPVATYALFGLTAGGNPTVASDPQIANMLFVGFAVFAVIGPGLFGIGVSLATERTAGLLKLKRALPAPAGSSILAKLAMGFLFALLAVLPVFVVGLSSGKVTLSAAHLLVLAGVLGLGSLPFCAIGLFIGSYASGSAAPAFTNLVYLPSIWLSGMFIPLPAFLRPQTIFWPAFHVDQLALEAVGLTKFVYVPTLVSAAVVAGITVLFSGLAIQRLSRKG